MIVFGESETEKDGTFRRNHFCHYIMLCKIYFIVVRSGSLAFMSKPTGTFFLVKHRFAYYRHDRKLPVIVNPRTGLMGLFEASNLVLVIFILPAISHLSGLWYPEIHAPWHGHCRICVAGREFKIGQGSYQRIHIIDRCFFGPDHTYLQKTGNNPHIL